MSKLDKNLSSVFDVEPIQGKNTEIVDYTETTPEVVKETKIDDDYENTRNNLYALLNKGKTALEHALEVAQSSEHPRAFEVVGGLMKQLSDINHQLVDLHTKRQELESRGKTEQTTAQAGGNVTNNAIFVGSTTELSKMIENMRRGD